MVYIIADGASLTFPLLGSDAKFARKLSGAPPAKQKVGGRIVTDDKGHRGIVALENLNFELQPGTRLGLKGHNGAGKSTLLRVMAGIYSPSAGTIETEGRISSLFNLTLGVNREASGRDNIIFKGLMYGLRRREINALIDEIEEFSELGEYLYMPMKTYSSGMVMRLLFATAAAMKPDIMLLDEWITTGDPEFRRKVDERMEQMVDDAHITVIASHDQARLEKWSNRLITMEAGRIVSDEQ